MPVKLLNVTYQGPGIGTEEAQEYHSWKLFAQPPEVADIITEGIHIVIYLSIYVYLNI